MRGLRKLFAKFEFRIEKKIVENANHLITVSKGLANFLSKKINKPVHVIYNGTNERRFEQIKTFQFHEPTIVYSGSIYNGKYDLTPFFEGFSLFMTRTDFRIKIRILFVGSKIPYSWIRLAKRLNIYSYIDFEPKQDINQVNAKQKGAFMLLLPLWKNEKQGIITSKIFEYLSVKSPILAIGNQSEVLELIEDYGKGIMSENPKEIANFIFENLQFHESINKSLKNIEKKEQVKQIIRLIKSSKYDEKS